MRTFHSSGRGRAAVAALVGAAAGLVAATAFVAVTRPAAVPRTPAGTPSTSDAGDAAAHALLRELIGEVRALRRSARHDRGTATAEAPATLPVELEPPPLQAPRPAVPPRVRLIAEAERPSADFEALQPLRRFGSDPELRSAWLLVPETDVLATFGLPTEIAQDGRQWQYVRRRNDGARLEEYAISFDALGRLTTVHHRTWNR